MLKSLVLFCAVLFVTLFVSGCADMNYTPKGLQGPGPVIAHPTMGHGPAMPTKVMIPER